MTTSIKTALGRLCQEQKNLQPTKQVISELEIEEDSGFDPGKDTVKIHELCATIIPFNTKKGIQQSNWRLPTQVNQRKFVCHAHV